MVVVLLCRLSCVYLALCGWICKAWITCDYKKTSLLFMTARAPALIPADNIFYTESPPRSSSTTIIKPDVVNDQKQSNTCYVVNTSLNDR